MIVPLVPIYLSHKSTYVPIFMHVVIFHESAILRWQPLKSYLIHTYIMGHMSEHCPNRTFEHINFISLLHDSLTELVHNPQVHTKIKMCSIVG